MLRSLLVVSLLAAELLGGCSGSPSAEIHACGEPPPTAAPNVSLVFPRPGATGVSVAIGAVIFEGGGSLLTPASISIASSTGPVTVATVAQAPFPYPTPNAIAGGTLPGALQQASIAALAPATLYNVGYAYVIIEVSGPPSCDLRYVVPLGSFTTR